MDFVEGKYSKAMKVDHKLKWAKFNVDDLRAVCACSQLAAPTGKKFATMNKKSLSELLQAARVVPPSDDRMAQVRQLIEQIKPRPKRARSPSPADSESSSDDDAVLQVKPSQPAKPAKKNKKKRGEGKGASPSAAKKRKKAVRFLDESSEEEEDEQTSLSMQQQHQKLMQELQDLQKMVTHMSGSNKSVEHMNGNHLTNKYVRNLATKYRVSVRTVERIQQGAFVSIAEASPILSGVYGDGSVAKGVDGSLKIASVALREVPTEFGDFEPPLDIIFKIEDELQDGQRAPELHVFPEARQPYKVFLRDVAFKVLTPLGVLAIDAIMRCESSLSHTPLYPPSLATMMRLLPLFAVHARSTVCCNVCGLLDHPSEACSYREVYRATKSSTPRGALHGVGNTKKSKEQSKEQCRLFMSRSEKCRFGTNCKFLHACPFCNSEDATEHKSNCKRKKQ